MDEQQRQNIEQACTKLVNQFSCFNDRREFEALSNLFTPEGAFARPTDPDNYIEGRENILAAFNDRPQDRITRHLISNVIIDVENATSASGTCYATLFMAPADAEPARFGVQANSSQLVGEFQMDFSLTPAGWKIARQTGRIIFTT